MHQGAVSACDNQVFQCPKAVNTRNELTVFQSVLLILLAFLLGWGDLQAQRISRNDSLRTHYQDRNVAKLATIKPDTSVSATLGQADEERLEGYRKTRDDASIPFRERIVAQWNLVARLLYRDTRASFPEVQNYVRMAEQFKDSVNSLGHALSCLGFYYQKLGNFDSARIAYNRALDFAQDYHHPVYILNARIDLSVLEEKQGNYDAAIVQYYDILDSCLQWRQTTPEARCRINLGNLLLLKGDFTEALIQLQEALDLCTIGDLDGYMASTYLYLGDLNLAIEEFETAESFYQNALKWSDIMNNSTTKRMTLAQLTRLREKQGRREESLNLCREMIRYSHSLGLVEEEAEDHFLMAELLQRYGRTDSALQSIDRSLNLYKSIAYPERLYKALGIAGRIFLDADKLGKAEKYCLESYRLLTSQSDLEQKKLTCECLYRVYKVKKDEKRALAYLEEYEELEQVLSDKEAMKNIVKQQMSTEFKYRQYQDSVQNRNAMALVELQHQQKLENRSRLILFLMIGLGMVALATLVLWQAFRQNRKQKRDLDKLNQLNKQIFSIISHDFRGPLLSLNILVDTLKGANIDERRLHSYLKDIGNQISQTTNVLDNLLNWARAELQIDLAAKPSTAPCLIAREMKEAFATKLAEKKIDFEIDLAEDVRLEIHPDLLRILFRNLLSNAIKYSLPGGKIQINYDAASKQLSVHDTGVGMSVETLSQLMKAPIYSKMGTARESGFGIGLYVTAELLRKIGWTLHAESELQRGTVFVVTTKG